MGRWRGVRGVMVGGRGIGVGEGANRAAVSWM